MYGVIVRSEARTAQALLGTAVDGKQDYFPTVQRSCPCWARVLPPCSASPGCTAAVSLAPQIPSDTLALVARPTSSTSTASPAGNFVYFRGPRRDPEGVAINTTGDLFCTSRAYVRLCRGDPKFHSYVSLPFGCTAGRGGIPPPLQAAYLTPSRGRCGRPSTSAARTTCSSPSSPKGRSSTTSRG